MRQASKSDCWNRIERRKGLPLYIKKLVFEDVKNIKNGNIEFGYGITAICGANGVGKTTILEGINNILSAGDFDDKMGMFLESKLYLELLHNGREKTCSNEELESLNDWFEYDSMLKYITTGSSIKCMERFKSEENIEEYFESTEEVFFSKRELEVISMIIGKEYDECRVYLIEETMDYAEMPFFILKSNGIEYDTRNMGVGEHSIIYLYYYLKNMNNAIILLEEPENFIPPYSQKLLAQLISELCMKNKLNIILTTHSNHILQEIPDENIVVIRRNAVDSSVIIDLSKEQDYLRPLGLQFNIKGYLLVEDFIAKLFLKSIIKSEIPWVLSKYKIISIPGGCSELSKILKLYKSSDYEFQIIGAFDGDMNNDEMKKQLGVEEFKWNHTYLPYEISVERVFRQLLNSPRGLDIASKLHKDKDEFIRVLSDIQMFEDHDWIHEVARGLNINIETLVDTVVKYQIENDNEIYTVFISELLERINSFYKQ